MARLDPLLQALVQRKADELVLDSDQRPVFRLGATEQPVSQQALNAQQIRALLTEIRPELAGPGDGASAPTEFEYVGPDGRRFQCRLVMDADALRASVRPAPAAPSVPVGAAVEAPVAGDLDALLRRMVELEASDLHLSSMERPRIRLHGEIQCLEGWPELSPQGVRELIDPVMPPANREQYEATHDTDFAYEIPGVARFRVNVFTDRKGPGIVFRVIPARILTAEELGLPQAILELCKLPKGLVLVTGPTGSGKSTTLASMVDHINRNRAEHVITIEDPIEFVHENRRCLINQREVHNHTEGFKTALRAALREDPDIVLVGELRDLETISIAMETAETGHLVFGTLHTTTACSTVDRIIDQFPADRQNQVRTMLSESLRGVVAQTLLRKIGGGRVAALEVLLVTPAISNLIREGKTFQIPSLMQTGKKRGMTLLNDALLDLVKRKRVEPEEAYRRAADKSGLAGLLRGANIPLNVAPEH